MGGFWKSVHYTPDEFAGVFWGSMVNSEARTGDNSLWIECQMLDVIYFLNELQLTQFPSLQYTWVVRKSALQSSKFQESGFYCYVNKYK